LALILVKDLDDMAIRAGVQKLENISTRRQEMLAYSWNFDGPAEGNNCFVIPFVGLCFRRGEQAEYGKAESCS
jgi:hypothetical protein